MRAAALGATALLLLLALAATAEARRRAARLPGWPDGPRCTGAPAEDRGAGAAARKGAVSVCCSRHQGAGTCSGSTATGDRQTARRAPPQRGPDSLPHPCGPQALVEKTTGGKCTATVSKIPTADREMLQLARLSCKGVALVKGRSPVYMQASASAACAACARGVCAVVAVFTAVPPRARSGRFSAPAPLHLR